MNRTSLKYGVFQQILARGIMDFRLLVGLRVEVLAQLRAALLERVWLVWAQHLWPIHWSQLVSLEFDSPASLRRSLRQPLRGSWRHLQAP